MTWPVVAISEVAQIVGGSTPSRTKPHYWDGEIAWATPKDLSNLEGPYLEDTPQRISQAGFESCSTYLLPKGSVLLSSRAPIGLVAITGREMCTNQGFKSFVLKGDIDSLYLYHFLKKNRSSIEGMGSGSTFKEISKAATARLQIPLPPLDIQKKIAAVLDKADSIRRKRKQVMAKVDELLQSVFLDMFGDPVTNPKGWEVKSFRALLEREMGNGLSPSTEGTISGEVLTLSAITGPVFEPSARKKAHFSTEPSGRQLVHSRTFLVCRGNGNLNLVGRAKFPRECPPHVIYPDTMIGAQINTDLICPSFIETVWQSRSVRTQIERKARTTNGTYKINQTALGSIRIPVPPLLRQKEFAAFAGRITKGATSLLAETDRLDDLFNSLLQRAFKGELQFNDEAFP